MGAGIAQLSCLSGARTLLHDPEAQALDRGVERIKDQLHRGAERGRWDAGAATDAAERLHAVPRLEDLSTCELVIEAAPERLELKRELFSRLSNEVVSEDCVLATNTSSLLITAIASAAKRPERVVGMHFFNPAPVMVLVEVVAWAESSEPALAVARAAGEAMGKRVIAAADGPGFLVNRCNRPFGLEALKLLGVGRDPGRAFLHHARQADRLGRGRAGTGARTNRLPTRQRGSIRSRRRAGKRSGHRLGHDAGIELPPWHPRLGGRDRPRPGASGTGRARAGARRRALSRCPDAPPTGVVGQARTRDRRRVLLLLKRSATHRGLPGCAGADSAT